MRYLTESPAAAGGLLDHDAGTDDVSELGEEAEQGLVGHGVGDVEHEQVAPIRACSPEFIKIHIKFTITRRQRERKNRDGNGGAELYRRAALHN